MIDSVFARNLTDVCDVYNPVITVTNRRPTVHKTTKSYSGIPCKLIDLRGTLPITWSVYPESTHLVLTNYEDSAGTPYNILEGGKIVIDSKNYLIVAVIDPAGRHHHLEISTKMVRLP